MNEVRDWSIGLVKNILDITLTDIEIMVRDFFVRNPKLGIDDIEIVSQDVVSKYKLNEIGYEFTKLYFVRKKDNVK